jgi:hypothetical protein
MEFWVEKRIGQAVCCCTTRLAREALRPPVASLPSRGWSHPHAPATRGLRAPSRRLRGLRPRSPRSRPWPWRPTVRRLNARQSRAALDRHSWEPCSPMRRLTRPSATVRHIAGVRLSRPAPRRKAFPPHLGAYAAFSHGRLDPDQPYAGWTHGNGVAHRIASRGTRRPGA